MTDQEVFEEFMRNVTPELPVREQVVPDRFGVLLRLRKKQTKLQKSFRAFLNNYQPKGEQS